MLLMLGHRQNRGRMLRKFPPADIQEMQRLRAEGASMRSIATRFHCDPGVVLSRINNHAPTRGTALDDDAILRRFEAGESMRCIAESLGVYHSTIARILRRRGYKSCPPQWGLKVRLNSKEVGYLAGFIDGEGCICIQRRPDPPRRDNYQLVVLILNTNQRVMEWLKTRLGCGTYSIRKPYSPRHLPVIQYGITARKAADLLALILPHMIVKREQAALGLAYFRSAHELRDPEARHAAALDYKARMEMLRSPHARRGKLRGVGAELLTS
jgi:hypothetical protein